MYKHKLNPRVFNTFQLITRQKVGLMCILTPPNSSSKYINLPEMQRFSRLEEEKLQKTLKSSAITLQKNIRTFLAKRQLLHLKNLKEFRIKNEKARQIQAYFRGYTARNRVKFLKLCKKLAELRNSAAKLIQKNYKAHVLKTRVQVLAVVHQVIQIRNTAAKHIQKVARGYLVRKDLCFVRSKFSLLVFWRYFARSVFIAGNFTFPPWKVEIPLVYSKYLNGFYSGFFIENKLDYGTYTLKFIVDGCWLCDGHYPLSQDSEGNYNNIITIKKPILKVMKSQSTGIVPKLNNSSKCINFDKIHLDLHPRMKSSLLLNENCNTNIEIFLGSCLKKVEKLGEDKEFLFADQEFQCFGIGTGNKKWEMFGVNPGQCVKNLVCKVEERIKELFKVWSKGGTDKERILRYVLENCWNGVKGAGSACVLFGFCVDNVVNFVNLGDSRLILLRKVKGGEVVIVFASGRQYGGRYREKLELCDDQIQEFPLNPYIHKSLSLLNSVIYSGKPEDSEFFSVNLQPDDIFVVVSSGILHNLFDEDISHICERLISENLTPSYFCEKTAKTICKEAKIKSQDCEYRSPYWKEAKSEGRIGIGGRKEDFSVIVGLGIAIKHKWKYI